MEQTLWSEDILQFWNAGNQSGMSPFTSHALGEKTVNECENKVGGCYTALRSGELRRLRIRSTTSDGRNLLNVINCLRAKGRVALQEEKLLRSSQKTKTKTLTIEEDRETSPQRPAILLRHVH